MLLLCYQFYALIPLFWYCQHILLCYFDYFDYFDSFLLLATIFILFVHRSSEIDFDSSSDHSKICLIKAVDTLLHVIYKEAVLLKLAYFYKFTILSAQSYSLILHFKYE